MELEFLLGVKIIHLLDRTGLFKISNLVLGREGIVTDMYSSLERHRERERVIERGREKTSKTRGDYASYDREQRYVSEPTETKYLKF
jgi:hypothetical protein